MKKCVVALALAMMTVSAVFAQKKSETTVEQEYLSTVEDIIIRELAISENRDNKLVSLQYLEDAIAAGRKTPDMQEALASLAGEGIINQSRTNGRLVNNYPDIRVKACELLGQMGSEESKNTLLKVALADNEPSVVTAAIKSLGDIGLNDNNEVVETIVWTQKKYAALNPTSSLALQILVAYEKLADSVEDTTSMINSIAEISTNYNYITPVRQYALELLKKLSGR